MKQKSYFAKKVTLSRVTRACKLSALQAFNSPRKKIDKQTSSYTIISLVLAAFIIPFNTSVQATILSSDVAFSSQDQSMWGSGAAFQLDKEEFYGLTWNESGSVGGFIGGNTSVPNPLYGAWAICDGGDIFNTGVCGSAPSKTFNVDTTSGLQVAATTTGKIGFELGVKIDSGSIDTLVDYNTTVITPEVNTVAAGEFINLNTSSSLTGDNLSSQFPTMSASLGVVMEVSAGFSATGCLVGLCDSTSFNTGTLGGTQELISFNKDGEGGIEYFGGDPILETLLLAAVDLPTGFPAEIAIPAPSTIPGLSADLATITAHLPEPNASGGVNAAGTKLVAQGQDDLLDISLDVDTMLSLAITSAAGAPNGSLFGGNLGIGAGFGLEYDLINVELGPQIDLVQSFEFTPTLMVDLEFSKPVNVAGQGWVSTVAQLYWDVLPDMAFGDGTTTILPTFYLGTSLGGAFTKNAGDLFNQLFLDIDGNIKVDLLTATFTSGFGDLTLGIGNLLDESFDLFTSPALFSTTFAMGGFDSFAGTAFDVTVPEPGILILLGTGFLFLGLNRRRKII